MIKWILCSCDWLAKIEVALFVLYVGHFTYELEWKMIEFLDKLFTFISIFYFYS